MPRVSGSGTAVAFLILAAGLAGLESTAGAQSATPPPVREGWSIPLDGAKWEERNRQRKHMLDVVAHCAIGQTGFFCQFCQGVGLTFVHMNIRG